MWLKGSDLEAVEGDEVGGVRGTRSLVGLGGLWVLIRAMVLSQWITESD